MADPTPGRGWQQAALRLLRSLLRIGTVTVLSVAVLLLVFQRYLIYHPRRYAIAEAGRDPALVTLAFTTAQGRQVAYYLPPQAMPLRHLWVLFPGNGSLALDWLYMLYPRPDPRDGYLMIEYPGYGDCQGSASPGAIETSAEAAFNTLAATLHETPEQLGSLDLLCHSLGCATGLNFAVRHPVDRIILAAPFTSMRDMAARTVGWPLCWVLTHNYDNRARLAELAARPHSPQVTIFHGEDDNLIPAAMGQSLAASHPQMIIFHEIPDAGHGDVVSAAREEIAALMR